MLCNIRRGSAGQVAKRRMDSVFELLLVSGSHTRLTLPEAGEFASFYVVSMEYSGNVQFWELLTRLMAAAGRPVCAFNEWLREQGLKEGDLTKSALRSLLHRRGYGFGILFDINPVLQEAAAAESHKLLFLRDPRSMLVATYRHLMRQAADAAASAPASFDEFLESPAAERVAKRYRRFAEFRRQQPNVTMFRYEHAVSGWHQIAADIVATLDLPIETLKVASIAAAAPPIGDRLPVQDRRHRSSASATDALAPRDVANLETRFADVIAAYGYAPSADPIGRPHVPLGNGQRADAAPKLGGPRQAQIVPRLGAIFEPDPVLLARLRPNTSAEMFVLGRKVTMEVDATGCRPVIGQPAAGEKTLAAYGCSFTYGIAIKAEETFCSLLQGLFPTWRVENHGISGHGTSHNLIQLERESRWNRVEFVTFCWIAQHLFRNVADINWVQLTSQNMLKSATGKIPDQSLPRATVDADGVLQMRSVRVPRGDLLGIDFSEFAINPHHTDQVCFRLFERANWVVTGYGGHFFVTTLQGKLSAWLSGRLADAGIPVVDASLLGNEYLCLPDDPHANALANRIYAERIHDYLLRYMAEESKVR
jgi:hypothetical protein